MTREYIDICSKAADQCRKAMRDAARRGPPTKLNLYYRAGEIRGFAECEEAGEEWTLANAEPIRGHVPYSAFYSVIYERCRSVPCLSPI